MTNEVAGRELAIAPQREIRVVDDPVAIFSTAKFEHIYRIARVLADAQLLPETLTHVGKADKREMLPADTIRARAFLIAAQAERWGMDPMAVAQATSIVHNRLMYEGKLVAAVLEAKLGVRLNYRYNDAKGDAFGVETFATLPGETEPRVVRGTVGQWKTSGNNSPWGNPQNHERMLAYRSARDFCRLHAPGLILGIITDDELDEIASRTPSAAPKTLAMAYDASTTPKSEAQEPAKAPNPAPEPDSAPAATSEPETAKEPPTAPKSTPASAPIATLDDYEAMVDQAETADAVFGAFALLRQTPIWKNAEPEGQRTWACIAGNKLEELATRGVPLPLPKNSVDGFRIWCMTGRRDPAKVATNFAGVMRLDAFRSLPEAEQEEITAMAAAE